MGVCVWGEGGRGGGGGGGGGEGEEDRKEFFFLILSFIYCFDCVQYASATYFNNAPLALGGY